MSAKDVYNSLTAQGVKLGGYDKFSKAMSSPARRKILYNQVRSYGIKLGSFNDFSASLDASAPPKKTPTKTTSAPQKAMDWSKAGLGVPTLPSYIPQPNVPTPLKRAAQPTPTPKHTPQKTTTQPSTPTSQQWELPDLGLNPLKKFEWDVPVIPETDMYSRYVKSNPVAAQKHLGNPYPDEDYERFKKEETARIKEERRRERMLADGTAELSKIHSKSMDEGARKALINADIELEETTAPKKEEKHWYNIFEDEDDKDAKQRMDRNAYRVARMKTHDLEKMMTDAWNYTSAEVRKSWIDNYKALLRKVYPNADGKWIYDKALQMAHQESAKHLYDYAVQQNMPKNALWYIFERAKLDNFLYRLDEGAIVAQAGGKTGDMAAMEAAVDKYGQNASLFTNVVATGVSLMSDPTTYFGGGVGGIAAKVVGKALGKRLATKLVGRITSGVAGSAVNLGTFEGVGELTNQILHGGQVLGFNDDGTYIIGDYSAGAVLESGLHGTKMGAAIGWLGPLSGNITDKVVRNTSKTSTKMLERVAIGAGTTVLEGTIFAAPELLSDTDNKLDIWTNSVATIAGLKAKHAVKTTWGYLSDVADTFRSPKDGRKSRLDFISKWRMRLDTPSDGGLALTKDEEAELKKYGYDFDEVLKSHKPFEDKKRQDKKTERSTTRSLVEDERLREAEDDANAVAAVDKLNTLVNDSRVSEAARAKMYYFATGRALPASTILDGELTDNGDGTFTVQSHGANGVITSRTFKSRHSADLELERINRVAELNTIELGERAFRADAVDGRLTEACTQVSEDGGFGDPEKVKHKFKEIQSKLQNKENVTEAEKDLYKKVSKAFGELDTDESLNLIKGLVSEKFGVDVEKAISKDFNRRTDNEQKAIDEYKRLLKKDDVPSDAERGGAEPNTPEGNPSEPNEPQRPQGGGQQPPQSEPQQPREYEIGDEVSVYYGDTPARAVVQDKADEDGYLTVRYEAEDGTPLGVHKMKVEEFRALDDGAKGDDVREETPTNSENVPVSEEKPTENVPTPLERIPRNEKGEPAFEQAESPEVGWDGLVEFSGGDSATAKEVADAMVEEKRKALDKAQKQKLKGTTPTEMLASKQANAEALAKAEAEYDMWQKIANVEKGREDERIRQEEEARQRAEAEKAEADARAAEEARIKAKEEADKAAEAEKEKSRNLTDAEDQKATHSSDLKTASADKGTTFPSEQKTPEELKTAEEKKLRKQKEREEKKQKKQKKQSVFDKAKEIADREEKKRKAEAEDNSVLGQATRAVGKKKKVDPFKYAASKKDAEEVWKGVHYVNGYAYATDGFILFKEKADYPKEWEGTTRDKDGNLIEGEYPDAEKAIRRPVYIPDKEVESLPSKEMLDFAIAVGKKLKVEIMPVAIDGIFFDAVKLKKFLEAVVSKGMDKVVYRHPMLYATNGKDEIGLAPTLHTLGYVSDIADQMERSGLPKEQIDAWRAHIKASDKKMSFEDFTKAEEKAKKESDRPTEAERSKQKEREEKKRKRAELARKRAEEREEKKRKAKEDEKNAPNIDRQATDKLGEVSDKGVDESELPKDMAFRVTDVNEVADILETGGMRSLPDGSKVEGAKTEMVKSKNGGSFKIGRDEGRDHGGKGFSKGKVWTGTAGGSAQKVIIGVPGEKTQWREGFHGKYTKPKQWGEIENDKPLLLEFGEDGRVKGVTAEDMRFWVRGRDGKYYELTPHVVAEKRQARAAAWQEYREATKREEDIRQEYEKKRADYIKEHYPTQVDGYGDKESPQYYKEWRAKIEDPELEKMKEDYDKAIKEARDKVREAGLKLDEVNGKAEKPKSDSSEGNKGKELTEDKKPKEENKGVPEKTAVKEKKAEPKDEEDSPKEKINPKKGKTYKGKTPNEYKNGSPSKKTIFETAAEIAANEEKKAERGSSLFGRLNSLFSRRRDRKAAERVAKAFGYKIEWVETDSENNGRVDHRKKVITIAKDAEMPLNKVFGHELTHTVRKLGEASYNALRDAVKAVLGDKELERRMEAKRNERSVVTKEKAYEEEHVEEEVIADAVGDIVNSEDNLRRLAERLRNKPSVLTRIREALKKLFGIVKESGDNKVNEELQKRMKVLDAIIAAADRDGSLPPNGELVNKQGDVVARTDKVGNIDFSHKTYHDFVDEQGNKHEGTRERVVRYLEKNKMSKEDIKKFTDNMDYWYDLTENAANLVDKDGNFKYEEFHRWSQTTPLYKTYEGNVVRAVSTLVTNGEYPLNFELSTDCIKREAFTKILNKMLDLGGAFWENLTPAKIQEMRTLQQSYGVQVACPLCFVEGKRLNIMKWATGVTDKWNNAVRTVVGDKDVTPFGFGEGTFIPDRPYDERTTPQTVRDQINEVARIVSSRDGVLPEDLARMQANAKAMEDKLQEFYEKYVGKHGSAEGFRLTKSQIRKLESLRGKGGENTEARMVAMIATHPELQHTLDVSDLVGSKGLTAIRSQSGEAFAKMYSLIVSANGTGTPKIVQEAQPYSGEILDVSKAKFKKAGRVGGARLFSFSDFDITKTFDIMQIMWDCAVRGAKVQSYSKEVPYILLFGKCGVKINMSMLPEARPPKELVEQYKAAPSDTQRDLALERIRENAGLEMDGDHIVEMQLSDSHSVSKEFAEEIFHNPEYNGNCGAIMVGVSVNHCLYAMGQDYIRQVIPFHLSGMPIAARRATDCQYYRDFTSEQNTGVVIDGSRVKLLDSKGKSIVEGVDGDFDFYEGENRRGWNIRQRCRDYVKWCADNGLAPRFEWAVNSDNYKEWCRKKGYKPNEEIVAMMDSHTTDGVFDEYYKVITDFTAYKPVFDKDGNLVGEEPAPHRPVTGDFAIDEETIKMAFGVDAEGNEVEGRTMLENREKSIRNVETNMEEIAEKSLLLLNDKTKVEDVVKRGGEEFDNNDDSDLFMERKSKEASSEEVNYSRRTKPAPKKTKKVSSRGAALLDALIGRMRKAGLFVSTDAEEGQRVLDEENGKARKMSFGEPYNYETYPLGRVEANLSEKSVELVNAGIDHGFSNYKEARTWAKQNIAKAYNREETGGKGDVRISNAAIDKFLSQSAVDKSDSKDVHMAVLRVLPDVLKTSIDVETHPDFLKGEDGNRNVENGINKDVLVHRCYGAVNVDGKLYRVKITLKENIKTNEITNTHSYEATKIELLAGQHGDVTRTSPRNSNSSIAVAKLLENVEMSYNPSEKILDASKKRSKAVREQRVFHGSGADFDHVRFFRTTDGEAYGFTVDGKIYLDPRIATSETAVHEYTHLWTDMLRRTDMKQWEHLVKELKGSRLWEEVKGSYPKLETDAEIADEVLSTLSGRRGSERLRKEMDEILKGDGSVTEKAAALSALERVKKSVNDFWRAVLKMFGIDRYYRADELADIALKDLLAGKNPMRNETERATQRRGDAEKPREQRAGSVFDAATRYSEESEKKDKDFTADEDFTKEDVNYSVRTKTPAKARDRYEKKVKGRKFQMREAMQDSMLGLKEMMLSVVRGEGRRRAHVEDIPDFENPYLGENRYSSVVKERFDTAARNLFKPLIESVRKLTAKGDGKRKDRERELNDYLLAKHGVERDEVMRRREAKEKYEKYMKKHPTSDKTEDDFYNSLLWKDYAGLTGLTKNDPSVKAMQDEIDTLEERLANETDPMAKEQLQKDIISLKYDIMEERRAVARRMATDYEYSNDTTELWNNINKLNNATLETMYKNGLLSKEQYESIRDMYRFYVPLRGFDEDTSHDVYDYINTQEYKGAGSPLKKAKGRSSRSDDPIAYMQSMYETAVMQSYRNSLIQQKMFNFVVNHPSDLASVSKLWLAYDPVADEWKPVFPDNIKDTDDPSTVAAKMEDFNNKMEALAKSNPDMYKSGEQAEGIPYRVVSKSDKAQHQIVAKVNGVPHVITINGNPRAALAANGRTNPNSDLNGSIGKLLERGEAINRQLSAFYTTRNIDFVGSNFVRDLLFGSAMTAMKENPLYFGKYVKNYAKAVGSLGVLFNKYELGKLGNSEIEKHFRDYMKNGGETGYVSLKNIERQKSAVKKELKTGNHPIYKGWYWLGQILDNMNRWAENSARFATYMTSRESGRSVGKSVWDAKQITVNFNKKGAGATFLNAQNETTAGKAASLASGLGRDLFVFWNAGVQGLDNAAQTAGRHPVKALVLGSLLFTLGYLMAQNGADKDDDDETNYFNLSKYVRRSNICFATGDKYVSIPLPVEFRSMYGMGELAGSVINGKEPGDTWDWSMETVAQASQVLPLDFMDTGNPYIPSAAKPFWEVYENKDWTGRPIYNDTEFNKNMPEYTKVYSNANTQLVEAAKWLNENTGGDEFTKGRVDINPAKVEYMLKGYLGGFATLADHLVKTTEMMTGDREFDVHDVPIASRFVRSANERNKFSSINSQYYDLADEVNVTKQRLKGYSQKADEGSEEYEAKLDALYDSPEYLRYEIFKTYEKDIKKLQDEVKEATTPEEKIEAQRELAELQRELLEEIENDVKK